MSTELAFVGDVHGNLAAVEGLWRALAMREVRHVVFLGDYINKGAQSAEVLQELILHAEAGRATLLCGNHEAALIDAVDRRDLSGFLKMGGAMTIRSYVHGSVGPDVLQQFLASLPDEHLEALRRMPLTYETDDVVAQHIPLRPSTPKMRITAHIPVGDLPRINAQSAQLDTGCGDGGGRLTALFWPTLDYIQVDSRGDLVSR